MDSPNATYYRETAGYRGKRTFFYLGPIQIELIELIDGKTIHEAFLKEKGEGVHHIAFEVDNLEKSTGNAEKAGLKVIQSFTRPDGSGFAYLDTDKTGGIIFELIQRRGWYMRWTDSQKVLSRLIALPNPCYILPGALRGKMKAAIANQLTFYALTLIAILIQPQSA